MRGIKILLVAVAIVGLSLGSGVGAATGKPAASPAKAAGAHIRNVVIKGSAQSHGQIPARVKRLLRAAASNQYCPGATVSTGVGTQTCTWASTYTGQVTCLQTSNSAVIVQTCDASQIQTTSSRNNTALIAQIIISQNPPSQQNGTQIVMLRQTAVGTGSNTAVIGQYIKQSLGRGTPEDTDEGDVEPDVSATASVSQKQESHQIVHLRQISATGSNNAPILQFLRQRERASHAATTHQDQNVDSTNVCVSDPGSDALGSAVVVDANANQCILSNQTSASGKQNLLLAGDYNQFQRARKADQGNQTQGVPFTGGSDYGLIQDSTGVSNVLTIQNERQVQRALETGVLFTQSQNGPRKGSGSAQSGNATDTWTGRQTSTQIQTTTAGPASGQTNFLLYSAQQAPAGTMDVKQTASQNGGTPTTNTCSASPCEIAIVCVVGEGCAAPVSCSEEGAVVDPTTGTCTGFCSVFPSSPSCGDYYLTSVARSAIYRSSLYRHSR